MLENPEMEFRLSSNASPTPPPPTPHPFKSFFPLKMFHCRNNSSYLYKIDGLVSQQSLISRGYKKTYKDISRGYKKT